MTSVIDDYLNLITSEHAHQPKFRAMIELTLNPMVSSQNLAGSIPSGFDVDLAVGQQLDFTGQWVGFSRKLQAPIEGVYFALDTEDVGFDEGIWWNPSLPLEGLISLDDETYRLMIYAKIKANQWDGTVAGQESIVEAVFSSSPGTFAFTVDNMDMSFSVGVTGATPPPLLMKLLVNDYIPLRPEGVKLRGVYISSGPMFGLDMDTDWLKGFDEGSWGELVTP